MVSGIKVSASTPAIRARNDIFKIDLDSLDLSIFKIFYIRFELNY